MEKRTLVPLFIVCLAMLSGVSSWEGVAVAGASSDFGGDGFQAASSVFPAGRQVDVTALADGKTLRLLIVPVASMGGGEHFLLLSTGAASALGMKPGSELRVSVALVGESYRIPKYVPGMAETSDPDFNMKLLAVREKEDYSTQVSEQVGSVNMTQLQGGIFIVENTGKLVSSEPSSNPVMPAMKTPLLIEGNRSIQKLPDANPTRIKRFLQVGAFATAKAMKTVMHRFSPSYPMEIRPFMFKGTLHYRLLVGPLSPKDLKSAQARARIIGIQDAFQTD